MIRRYAMIVTCFAFITLGLLLFLGQVTWKRYNYWKWRNVPHLKPVFLFGNYKDYITLKDQVSSIEQKICQQFPQEPYVGTFYGTEPTLVVQDPELIGLITTKAFNTFSGREISNYCYKEVITKSIFFSYGQIWKQAHQALTPIFTLSKLRIMFQLIEKRLYDFEKLLDLEFVDSSYINVNNLMANYTMDCISSCFFGVNANTMDRTDKKNPFRIMGQAIFFSAKLKSFLLIVRSIWPLVFYGLRLRLFPLQINEFFLTLYKNVCKSRQYTPSSRNDLIDYFLSANQSDEFVTGSLVGLFGAGYETSASTLSYTLYELAKNEDIQSKVIREVDDYLIRTGGKFSYECVNQLPYLDACINEAMRLYPSLKMITREVMEDYTLPTGLRLEKGTRIHIPVQHMHYRPDLYHNPTQFSPERFLNDFIKPFTYFAFGEGHRQCLGKRLAKMQMLPSLVLVLKKYRLTLAESSPDQLQFVVGSLVSQLKDPIILKFNPRKNF